MNEENVIYGLYCVCDTCAGQKKIRYVGQTRVGMAERMRGHLKPFRNKQPYPVDKWKFKHGTENIRYEILETLQTPEELDSRERYWIEEHQTFTDWKKGGLNFTLGGQGWAGKAEEVIDKIRTANSRDTVPWAKINRAKASEIRERYRGGESTAKLAEEFGISRTHLSAVLNNQVWHDPDYTFERVHQPPIRDEDRKSYVLTREEAWKMRRRYQTSELTYSEMAEEFGVSTGVVINVLNNHVYLDTDYTPGRPVTSRARAAISKASKGVPKPPGHGEAVSKAIRGGNHGMSKLTEKEVIEIRRLRNTGMSSRELSEMFGVNASQITRICSGSRWGHVKEGLKDK